MTTKELREILNTVDSIMLGKELGVITEMDAQSFITLGGWAITKHEEKLVLVLCIEQD